MAAMPVLKVRAKDVNELAASAMFLFAKRPLPLDAQAEKAVSIKQKNLQLAITLETQPAFERICTVLLALSANSPFSGGRDSGFASARTVIFQVVRQRLTPSAAALATIPGLEAATFIDIGCGKGDVSAHLARKGWQGMAIDFSDAAIGEEQRARVEHRNETLTGHLHE